MDKDYLDPFLHLKTLRWVEPYHGGMSIEDTGFCNRLLHWEIAYEINKLNDFKYMILLEDWYWKELKYLKLPYTRPVRDPYYSNHKVLDLKFRTVYDHVNKNVYLAEPISEGKMKDMVENNNFILEGDNYYSDFGYNFIEAVKGEGRRGLSLMEFKHKDFEQLIKKAVNGYVGLHIRRGEGIEVTMEHITNLPKEVQHLFSPHEGDPTYKWVSDVQYFEVIDGILKYHPDTMFYLSTDMAYDQYEYLLKRYPANIKTRKEVFNEVYFTANYLEKVDDWQFTCFLNIIDLFALGSCDYIVRAPASTWSEVAAIWKNTPYIDIDENPKKIIKKINKFLDAKRVRDLI